MFPDHKQNLSDCIPIPFMLSQTNKVLKSHLLSIMSFPISLQLGAKKEKQSLDLRWA